MWLSNKLFFDIEDKETQKNVCWYENYIASLQRRNKQKSNQMIGCFFQLNTQNKSGFFKLLAPIYCRHTNTRIDGCNKWLAIFVMRNNRYWWIISAKTSTSLKIPAFCTTFFFQFIHFTHPPPPDSQPPVCALCGVCLLFFICHM